MIIPSKRFNRYQNNDAVHRGQLINNIYLFNDMYSKQFTSDDITTESQLFDCTEYTPSRYKPYMANYYNIEHVFNKPYIVDPKLYFRAADDPYSIHTKPWIRVDNGCNYPDNNNIHALTHGVIDSMTASFITDTTQNWLDDIFTGKTISIKTIYSTYVRYKILGNNNNTLYLDTDTLEADGVVTNTNSQPTIENVLINGNFETGTNDDSWTATIGSAIDIVSDGYTSDGTHSARMFIAVDGYIGLNVDLVADTNYEFSFSYLPGYYNGDVYVEVINTNDDIVYSYELDLSPTSLNGRMIKHTISFYAATTGHTIRFRSVNAISSTLIYLDSVMLYVSGFGNIMYGSPFFIEANGFSSSDDGRYFQYKLLGGAVNINNTTTDFNIIRDIMGYIKLDCVYINTTSMIANGDSYTFDALDILFKPVSNINVEMVHVSVNVESDGDIIALQCIMGDYNIGAITNTYTSYTHISPNCNNLDFIMNAVPITTGNQYIIRIKPNMDTYSNNVLPNFNISTMAYIDTITSSIPSTYAIILRNYVGTYGNAPTGSTAIIYHGYGNIDLYAVAPSANGLVLTVNYRSNESENIESIGQFTREFDRKLNELSISDVDVVFDNRTNRYTHDHKNSILTSSRINEPMWISRGYRYLDDTSELYTLGKFCYKLSQNEDQEKARVKFYNELTLLNNIDAKTFGQKIRYMSPQPLNVDAINPSRNITNYYFPHRDIVPDSIDRIFIRDSINYKYRDATIVQSIGDLISNTSVQVDYDNGTATTGLVSTSHTDILVGGMLLGQFDNLVVNSGFDGWTINSTGTIATKYIPIEWEPRGYIDVIRDVINAKSDNSVRLRGLASGGTLVQTVANSTLDLDYVLISTYKMIYGTPIINVKTIGGFILNTLTLDSSTWATTSSITQSMTYDNVLLEISVDNGDEVMLDEVIWNHFISDGDRAIEPTGYKIYPAFYTASKAVKTLFDAARIYNYKLNEPIINSNKPGINILSELTYGVDDLTNQLDKDFVPTSMTYDPYTDYIYVSSDRSSKIYVLRRDSTNTYQCSLFTDLESGSLASDVNTTSVMASESEMLQFNQENFIPYSDGAVLSTSNWTLGSGVLLSSAMVTPYRSLYNTSGSQSIKFTTSLSYAKLAVPQDYDNIQHKVIAYADVMITSYTSGDVRLLLTINNTIMATITADSQRLGEWQRIKIDPVALTGLGSSDTVYIAVNGYDAGSCTANAIYYVCGFGYQYDINDGEVSPFVSGVSVIPSKYTYKDMQIDGHYTRWKIHSISCNPLRNPNGDIIDGDDFIYIYAYYDEFKNDTNNTYGRIFRTKINQWYEGDIIEPVTDIFNCSGLGASAITRNRSGQYVECDPRNTGAKLVLDSTNNRLLFKYTIVGNNVKFTNDVEFDNPVNVNDSLLKWNPLPILPDGHNSTGPSTHYLLQDVSTGDNHVYKVHDVIPNIYQFANVNIGATPPYTTLVANKIVNANFDDIISGVPSDWTVTGGGTLSATNDDDDIWSYQTHVPKFIYASGIAKINKAFIGSNAFGVNKDVYDRFDYYITHKEFTDDVSDILNATDNTDIKPADQIVRPFGVVSEQNNALYIFSEYPFTDIEVKIRANKDGNPVGAGEVVGNPHIIIEHYRHFIEDDQFTITGGGTQGGGPGNTRYVGATYEQYMWTPIPSTSEPYAGWRYDTLAGLAASEKAHNSSGVYGKPWGMLWIMNMQIDGNYINNATSFHDIGVGGSGNIIPVDTYTLDGTTSPFYDKSNGNYKFTYRLPENLYNKNRLTVFTTEKTETNIGSSKTGYRYVIDSYWHAAPLPLAIRNQDMTFNMMDGSTLNSRTDFNRIIGYWVRIRLARGKFTKQPEIEWIKLGYAGCSTKLHGQDAAWLGTDPTHYRYKATFGFDPQVWQQVTLEANKTYGVSAIMYGEIGDPGKQLPAGKDMKIPQEIETPVDLNQIQYWSAFHLFIARPSDYGSAYSIYYIDYRDAQYKPWRWSLVNKRVREKQGFFNTIFSPLPGNSSGQWNPDCYAFASLSALHPGRCGTGPFGYRAPNADIAVPAKWTSESAQDDGSWYHMYFQITHQASDNYFCGIDMTCPSIVDAGTITAPYPWIMPKRIRKTGRNYQRPTCFIEHIGVFEIKMPCTGDRSGSFDIDKKNQQLYYWDISMATSHWNRRYNGDPIEDKPSLFAFDYSSPYSAFWSSAHMPEAISLTEIFDKTDIDRYDMFPTTMSSHQVNMGGTDMTILVSNVISDRRMTNDTITNLLVLPIVSNNTIDIRKVLSVAGIGARSYAHSVVFNESTNKFVAVYGIPYFDFKDSNGVLAEISLTDEYINIDGVGRIADIPDIDSLGVGASCNLMYDKWNNRVLGIIVADRKYQNDTSCVFEYKKGNTISIPSLNVNKSGYEMLRRITEATGSILYQDHNGVWVLSGRDRIPMISIDNVYAVENNTIQPNIDESSIINKIIFTINGHTYIRVHEASLNSIYGERSMSISNDLIQVNMIDQIAEIYFSLYAYPVYEFGFNLGRKTFMYDLADIVRLYIDQSNTMLYGVDAMIYGLTYDLDKDMVGIK